jgi:hypothetical protein
MDWRLRPRPGMKFTGKFLQLVGLIVVASGFLFGIQYSLIKFELAALGIGSLIFYIGWILEKK